MAINKEIFEKIVREYADGVITIKMILKKYDSSVYELQLYFVDNPEAENLYSKIQIFTSDLGADEITFIADNEENTAKARNQIDARKFRAVSLNPRKYGPKVELNVVHVDLKQDLLEANARLITAITQRVNEHVMLPPCDLINNTSPHTIDITNTYEDRMTGYEPVTPTTNDIEDMSSKENDDIDIFS